jgi:hypothetical protein
MLRMYSLAEKSKLNYLVGKVVNIPQTVTLVTNFIISYSIFTYSHFLYVAKAKLMQIVLSVIIRKDLCT